MNTYSSVLKYLYQQLPMFQRMGAAAYKTDLENTYRICNIIGNPQNTLRFIHVAGTNGKGSVCHMTASILQEAGFKCGLMTSPHLKDFRERIRVNGQMISEDDVITFVGTYKDKMEKIQASFFEYVVGMSFWYFNKMKVEVVIAETGMGGRLDSTNVVTPEVSVITNIGMDHQQFLGGTIQLIAAEKAGIIKSDVPVVLGAMRKEAKRVMEDNAEVKGSAIYDSALMEESDYDSDLKGVYQKENVNTVLCIMKLLQSKQWNISELDVQKGLKRVKINTGFRGRWEILSEYPKIIADTGHNLDGVSKIIDSLETEKFKKLHMVWGMVDDKDSRPILELLPKNADYYFCCPNIPRGKPVGKMYSEAKTVGIQGQVFPSVQAALLAAKYNAPKEDLIFVGGSTFVVAEVV